MTVVVLVAEGQHSSAHCVTCWPGRSHQGPRSERSQS